MNCQNFEELPFQALFQMAEEKYESLDYEQAEYFYQLAYSKNPHDEILVLCYANLLKVTEKIEQSKKILEKSIKDIPSGTYKRYMELAQIYDGVKSIKTYQKGIQQAKKCLINPFKSTAPQPQIKRDIAQAYAGIAQVCLTDLINQKEAEGKCTQAMKLGIEIDKTCIDVKLQIANYLMWKDDFQSARKQLLQVYQWISQNREQYESQTINTTGKYLIEVEEYQKSFQLFEKLHEDTSSQLQVIYMLAFCSFKLKKYTQCEEYLEEYQQAKTNGQIVNEQIESAVNEMKAELAAKKKEHEETGEGQEEEDEWMDVEDQNDMEG